MTFRWHILCYGHSWERNAAFLQHHELRCVLPLEPLEGMGNHLDAMVLTGDVVLP